jgi:hypothetical protein
MRRVVYVLPFVTRGLALCAVLAGLGAGLLQATIGTAFICFDTCPSSAYYFAHLGPTAVQILTPCVVLEALAMAAFVPYCLATRQTRRAVLALLVLLVGGLVGIAALAELLQHAQATLTGEEGDQLLADQLQALTQEWGLALMFVAGAWSGVLAYLQWRR